MVAGVDDGCCGSAQVGFGQLHMRHSGRVPVGELSMSRPDELNQDFDFYYTGQAKNAAKATPATAEYRGRGESSAGCLYCCSLYVCS